MSWCGQCGGPYSGWPGTQYGGHWDTRPNRTAQPRVYIRKEATGWAFAVTDGRRRHATGTHIPTQQEALVAGLEALGWAESWERVFRLSAG